MLADDVRPCVYSFGIMQGRLSPPEGGRFQAFPREGWRQEITGAKQAGLDYIEWIHDGYGEGADASGNPANPIFSESGLAELDELKRKNGIATPALCGDWFMEFPLIRCSAAEAKEREEHLHQLIPIARRIGAQRIVLPFVDHSRMKTDEEKQRVIEILERAIPVAVHHGVELHLEADFGPAEFAEFLSRLPHAALKVNWDSGNSSGLGYVATEEFGAYGNRIGSVHIKDRYRAAGGEIETRPLGEGSADFDDVFRALRSSGYSGGLTLQVARGADNEEVPFIQKQLEYLRRYC